MIQDRDALLELLRENYRRRGWSFEEQAGVLTAHGTGGVDWLGIAVVEADLDEVRFADHIAHLADRRMATGELCPLDVMAQPGTEPAIGALLSSLGLGRRRHISVFSLVAQPAAA